MCLMYSLLDIEFRAFILHGFSFDRFTVEKVGSIGWLVYVLCIKNFIESSQSMGR